jgi:hypothetical protein
MYAVFINWDNEHQSPPIGPCTTSGEAQRLATKIRKRLWANGVKRRLGQVQVMHMRAPDTIWGWGKLR